MKKFKSKLKNQGGFTLIEMLIVVAIIAILVAVSIPLVNSSLEKARIATDAANERAAKAVATVKYLTDGPKTAGTYNYDAVTGTLVKDTPDVYGKCSEHDGAYVTVELTKEGVCTIKWSKGTTVHGIKAEPETTSTP